MLATGIPSYRLPRNIVEAEIQLIRDMGVTMKTGVEVGKDKTIARLRMEGFKAFFIAIGAQECKRLNVEGEDLEGVYDGLDYLRQVNLGKPRKPGERCCRDRRRQCGDGCREIRPEVGIRKRLYPLPTRL